MSSSLIQLLVLAGIAVFLIVKLRSVLGTREGFEKPPLPAECRPREKASTWLAFWREQPPDRLFHAVGDATLGQVVRRHLDLDLVAGQDADVVLAHAAGNVGRDHVAVLELDPEHGVREGLENRTFEFNAIVFGHSLFRWAGEPRLEAGDSAISLPHLQKFG